MKTHTLLFAGLGNPGKQYEMTRHNMGYLVVQALASKLGCIFKEDRRFNSLVAKSIMDGKNVHLLLPLTYMNLSGIAIKRYMDFYKMNVHGLVVIVDDIALPFGELRLKTMGSPGGHNGLKSVQECLGSSHFNRLRMGIGHPGEDILKEYVLDTFSQDEMERLQPFVDRGATALRRLVDESIAHVMNEVNRGSMLNTPKGDMENTTHESKQTKPL